MLDGTLASVLSVDTVSFCLPTGASSCPSLSIFESWPRASRVCTGKGDSRARELGRRSRGFDSPGGGGGVASIGSPSRETPAAMICALTFSASASRSRGFGGGSGDSGLCGRRGPGCGVNTKMDALMIPRNASVSLGRFSRCVEDVRTHEMVNRIAVDSSSKGKR